MYRLFKRTFDLIFSVLGLIFLLPLFIPIIIILKLTGEGEVFYFQNRIGEGSNYFHIWKFATMLKDSPNIGNGMITLRNDPRVTKVGRFLRKSKINELPQIINVIKGDMSLVGPRPTVRKHADAYDPEDRDLIYRMTPGITGIGSIIFRDEEKILSTKEGDPFENYKSYIIPFKKEVEIWYTENISFWTDFKILIATAWVIIVPKSEIIYSFFRSLPKRSF